MHEDWNGIVGVAIFLEINTLIAITMMNKFGVVVFPILLLMAADNPRPHGEVMYTWKECVEKARENHPDLQSAREKIAQSKADAGISRSALLPQIDANSTVSKSKRDGRVPATSSGMTESYSFGITGKQLLFDGAKSFYDLKSARKKAEASDYDYRVTSAAVRLSLRNAFIQLLKAQHSFALAKDIAKIRKQNYELVQMRYRAGVEHRGSLLTAEANLAQAEFEVAQADRSISLARHSLMKEMGLKEYGHIGVKGDFTVASADIEKPDMVSLANANPSVQRIVRQRESARYAMVSANTDYAPKIFGELSAGKTGDRWPPDNNEYSAGVQMSLNLFQGGKSYYASSKAAAAYRQLEADERSTRNTVMQALEQRWTALRNAVGIAGVQKKYYRAAEERAAIANAQYAIGTIQFDNWIIIQDALVNAKKNLLDAEANALASEAEWIQAKGGTLSDDE